MARDDMEQRHGDNRQVKKNEHTRMTCQVLEYSLFPLSLI